MKKRIFIIMKNDLVNYPPMLSLLRVMLETDLEVHYIGLYSDPDSKRELETKGIQFSYANLEHTGSFIRKAYQQYCYKKRIESVLSDFHVTKNDIVWYIYSNTAYFLMSLLQRYNYVVHFYEFMNAELSWKYRILYPKYSLKSFVSKAIGVVHCEYNRAKITQGLYSLSRTPYIISNKPYFDEAVLNNPPQDVLDAVSSVKTKLQDKFVILYQGVFHSSERRLEEFCEAAKMLPDNFVFVAMGSGGKYFEDLKRKYESNKVLFIPFIRPPYHLLITQIASVGVLTYHPTNTSYAGVINPLFCAPNKIFEFGRYSIPMVSNDIPGLRYIFDKYNCGVVIKDPMNPEDIAHAMQYIISHKGEMQKGARAYYDTVDLKNEVLVIMRDHLIS